MKNFYKRIFGGACLLLAAAAAWAQEDTIRQNLAEHIPALIDIDSVRETPMKGLYEVQVDTDLYYTDATGSFLIQGALLDLKAQKNLTEERISELTAIAYADLPLDDAFPVVYGKGTRQLAVFEDPNCPYCKQLEKELDQLDDLTVHTFLIPILGPDSVTKSRQIWCSKDPAQAWLDWMVRDVTLEGDGDCDTTALERNVEFAREHRITGTPTLIFLDGYRVPGAIDAGRLEDHLDEHSKH